MDINSDGEPSPIFKLFTPQTENQSKENGNINKETENSKASSSSHQLNNNDFDDCSQLPDGLRKCISTELIGKPLDDPFYGNNETFIVINKNQKLFRFSSTNSLWLFSPSSNIRSNAIRILTHPFHTIFMVIVILAFCWMAATDQPTLFDLRYFLIIFLLEFLLQIISHGLVFSPYSYLRNGWNVLDFILNILLHCGTFYFAELRILKIISYSLNLRSTIRLYWRSCKSLRDLLLYMTLMLIILSTLFTQIYMGAFTQACVKNGVALTVKNDLVKFCGNASGSYACPYSYTCHRDGTYNPNYGYTNFDSIFWSLLTTIRLSTRDYWEELLHLVVATCGPWHILTFIGMIFIVSYQVLSLIWGQIAISYNYIRVQRWEEKLIADDVGTDDVSLKETSKDEDAGWWSKFQRFIFFIIYNPYVVLFVIICIILNTLCMALDHHDMARELQRFLSTANYIFVFVFVIEAILKLLALGVVRYFKDEWNAFDFFVTVLGALEIALEGIQGLSVFRSFRLLRPLRLGKVVPAFDLILTRMQHLFSVVSGQTIIFFMAIYIFTVFGCHVLGPNSPLYNHHIEDGSQPISMWQFSDIMHSFMVVFRAICGEWIETLYIILLLTSPHVVCIIYYLLLVSVSSFQVMHIFTALLFTHDDSTAISTKGTQKTPQKSTKPKEKFRLEPFLKEKLLEPSIKQLYDQYRPKKDIESIGERPAEKIVAKAEIEADFDEVLPTNNADTSIPIEPTTTNSEDIALKNNENKYFQHCVTLCILAASITMAMDNDIHSIPHSTFHNISMYSEFLFMALLGIELMTKLISRGWKLCVTDIWYWIDLFNIVIAIVGVALENEVLAILASLRPLSLVSRFHGLHVIANAILKQMWFLTNTLLVCLAYWLIFAIMGVQLFGGKFYSCRDEDDKEVEMVNNRTECMKDESYYWTNSFMNFNDVCSSYYSLFEVSTIKGWLSIINDAVNSRNVDDQPKTQANIYMFFYFVIFIACAVFVCVNVIVGMLIQHMLHFGSLSELFQRTKSDSEESNGTVAPKSDTNETLDANPSSSSFVEFVRSHRFEKIAFACYIIFITVLMGEHYHSSVEFMNILTYIQLVLSILLIIEVILRGYAYRKEFFATSWNRFDVVVVVSVIIEFFVAEFVSTYVYSTSILRMIRIFRFNSLIMSSSKSLQRCVKILTRTWKPVSMLYLFLFLIICVYALIGMVLYDETEIEFGSFDGINFHTFGQSLLLLIQISTGAGWDGLLEEISKENSTVVAAIYMLSFLYISFTILLNVMLVIAFEFYREITSVEDDRKQLSADDLNDFNEKWKRFAQNDQNYVPKNRLKDFFNALDETSTLRPAEYNEREFALLGVKTRKDDNYGRSALLIALNRIRLAKQQS